MCGVFVSLFIYTRIEILTDYKWKWRNLVHCQKSFSPYFKVYKSTGKKWISILLHPSLWLHVLGTFRAEECHLTGMLFEYKLFSFTPSMYLTSVVFQFRTACFWFLVPEARSVRADDSVLASSLPALLQRAHANQVLETKDRKLGSGVERT